MAERGEELAVALGMKNALRVAAQGYIAEIRAWQARAETAEAAIVRIRVLHREVEAENERLRAAIARARAVSECEEDRDGTPDYADGYNAGRAAVLTALDGV